MVKEKEQLRIADRVYQMNKNKRNIFILFFAVLFSLAILILLDNILIQDSLICPEDEGFTDTDEAFLGYMKHKCFELLPAIFTVVWLTVPACRLKQILENKM